MRGQRAQDGAGAHVPEKYGLVEGAGDEEVAFGGEGEGADVGVVAEERRERERCRWCSGGGLPEEDGLVIGGRGEGVGRAGGGPGKCVYAGEVACQGLDVGEGRSGGVVGDGCGERVNIDGGVGGGGGEHGSVWREFQAGDAAGVGFRYGLERLET